MTAALLISVTSRDSAKSRSFLDVLARIAGDPSCPIARELGHPLAVYAAIEAHRHRVIPAVTALACGDEDAPQRARILLLSLAEVARATAVAQGLSGSNEFLGRLRDHFAAAERPDSVTPLVAAGMVLRMLDHARDEVNILVEDLADGVPTDDEALLDKLASLAAVCGEAGVGLGLFPSLAGEGR